MTNLNNNKIHIKDAIALLESGEYCNLKLWKLSTGEIINYKNCVCVGCHWRGGTHRIKILSSGLLREFRDVTLFNINGLEVFR